MTDNRRPRTAALGALPALTAKLAQTVRDSGPLWATTLALDPLLPGHLMRRWRTRSVDAARLSEQVRSILCAWGMPASNAETTAELMLYADLRGIDSHGCSMLRAYQRDLDAGRLDPTAEVTVVREAETSALLDGGGGLGHVPARVAMETAIHKCQASGMAAVAVRHSGHFGAAGAYAEMAAAQGLIGVATTATRAPAQVPTFAAEAMLGTNPIAFAAPAARQPAFLLDMATSTVPIGKIVMAWRQGRSIPEGWASGPGGRSLKNAKAAAFARRLSPLGGTATMSSHKGYGLAAVVEILSRVLPGAQRRDRGPRDGGEIGHFFLALDPAGFCGSSAFGTELDALIEDLHGAARARPEQPVLVAGDPERAALKERSRTGIPLTRSVFEELRSIARAAAVDFVLERPA